MNRTGRILLIFK